MEPLHGREELIESLLKIGAAPDINSLFALIVKEAPRLVGAEECSIFWKDGSWRERRRLDVNVSPNSFYRRATYDKKLALVGIDFYNPGEGLTGWVIKHGRTLRIDD